MAEITKSINTENVVASTGIGKEIELENLKDVIDGADYDPSQFPGLVYRTEDPKAAMLLFRSGKVVCTGAKSIEEIHQSLWIFFEKLRNAGIEIDRDVEVHFQNLVASADLGYALNLDAVAIGLGLENIEYDPEIFPGLVGQIGNPNILFLLFGSGKVVITGATSSRNIQRGVSKLVSRLQTINSPEGDVLFQNPSKKSPSTPKRKSKESNSEQKKNDNGQEYDVFISHASEDKDEIVRPLAEELDQKGVQVWYDEFELSIGDSLRESIDKGLSNSEYGIVILSEAFFEKKWTQYELNSLVSRHLDEGEVILPLWHDIGKQEVMEQSPMLADLLAERVNPNNIKKVAGEIVDEI